MGFRGYIQIYTGEGKGKTTAALGLALRAAGQGLTITMLQFLKGDMDIGEVKAASSLLPRFTIIPTGQPHFIPECKPTAEDKGYVGKAMELTNKTIVEGSADVLILDEVNVAVSLGLVPEEWILSIMRKKPAGMELVLTGRNATPAMIQMADLVTEMKEIKHYFRKGIPARKGIEK